MDSNIAEKNRFPDCNEQVLKHSCIIIFTEKIILQLFIHRMINLKQ